MLYYSTLFTINEYETSGPFKSNIHLLPSVTHILIDDIVVLLIGLKVIRRGSNVKLKLGVKTLVEKEYIISVSSPSNKLSLITMNIKNISILTQIWHFSTNMSSAF